jgi:hypothetical protein
MITVLLAISTVQWARATTGWARALAAFARRFLRSRMTYLVTSIIYTAIVPFLPDYPFSPVVALAVPLAIVADISLLPITGRWTLRITRAGAVLIAVSSLIDYVKVSMVSVRLCSIVLDPSRGRDPLGIAVARGLCLSCEIIWSMQLCKIMGTKVLAIDRPTFGFALEPGVTVVSGGFVHRRSAGERGAQPAEDTRGLALNQL